jgi:hypothetical protein
MAKTKKFQSKHEGPISVSVQGREPIRFEPGKVRTYETDDPTEIEALSANPDLEEVKGKK